MISIKINGLKETRRIMNKLPKEIKKEVQDKGFIDLGKTLQRMIRLRYSMVGYGRGPTSTKTVWRSIKYVKDGKIVKVNVGDEGSLIERGVPSHYVSHDLIEFRKSNPSVSTIGKTAKELGLAPPYKGEPFYWQYKGPFVEPAMKAFRQKISKKLSKYIQRAIKKAGGK